MLHSQLQLRHHTCKVARPHTTTHAARVCTSRSLHADMQTFHLTLRYVSAIAPFCARLMPRQVRSGIPPSLPTLFEGRHSCSSTLQLRLFLSGHVTMGFVESETFWHKIDIAVLLTQPETLDMLTATEQHKLRSIPTTMKTLTNANYRKYHSMPCQAADIPYEPLFTACRSCTA